MLSSLLAFTSKYGVPTYQWTWLYEALLEVSMTKIALWIRVYVDDWTAKSAVKASNDEYQSVCNIIAIETSIMIELICLF